MVNLIGAVLSGLLLAVAVACPAAYQGGARCAAVAGQPASLAPFAMHGALQQAVDGLSYSADAGTDAGADAGVVPVTADGAVPYQVVALGPPALVTTCGADLFPCTYALGADGAISTYPGWVPQLALGRLCALAPVAEGEADTGPGVMLLGADGIVLYGNPAAQLLAAPEPAADPAQAYVAIASVDGEAIYPLGSAPQLAAVDLASGAQAWCVQSGAATPVADVQLWAELDAQLLLVVQYDYQQFELLSLDRADGAVLARWPLTGMPAGAVVYPGPGWEPLQPEVHGAVASVVVYNDAGGAWERWRLDCAAGTVDKAACAAPETLREDNTLPVGGDGAPGPGRAPFPQRLLPTAWGEAWSVAALTDCAGRVLVVDSAGARWAEVSEVRP